MSTQEKQVELETVLQLYVEEISEPSPQTLKQWVRRYPQFKGHLTDLLIGDLFKDSVDEVIGPMNEVRQEARVET